MVALHILTDFKAQKRTPTSAYKLFVKKPASSDYFLRNVEKYGILSALVIFDVSEPSMAVRNHWVRIEEGELGKPIIPTHLTSKRYPRAHYLD